MNLRTDPTTAWRELSPAVRSRIAAVAWGVAVFLALGGVVSMAVATRHAQVAWRDAQARAAAQAGRPDAAAKAAAAAGPAPDFVHEFPAVAAADAQMRFAARLAQEQHVDIQQMQGEALKADPRALGQTRITLQLHGDYRDIKAMTLGLLEKYPGLTLDRMTIRHRAAPAPGGALAPADRGDDDASLELIQYLRPATAS